MNQFKRRSGLHLIILLLLLAACTSETVPDVVTDEGESSTGSETTPTEETVLEPTDAATEVASGEDATDTADPTTESEPTEDTGSEDETVVLPANLAFRVDGWNTNWSLSSIDLDELLSGGPPRDGIPPLDNPTFVGYAAADDWLADNEPVVALEIDGDAKAYPLQIMTWHEIVNDEVGGVPATITFCPLCNSAIVFDRRLDGVTYDFGTSGLLRNSDLVMWDRQTESLWQQFTGEAIIGDLTGTTLTFLPSALISYADFKAAYSDGIVLSRETGFDRSYGSNPYAGYDTIGSNPFLFSGPIDGRLPAVARVITVFFEDNGLALAYPLTSLAEAGVINDSQGGRDLTVFHLPGTTSALGASNIAEAEDVGGTNVFDRNLAGQLLTFSRDGEVFVDAETGSTWNIVGQGLSGPLEGSQLVTVVHADHFWFSWAAFRPDTIVYGLE